MECNDLASCFKEIEGYCTKPANGLSFFVHTENEETMQRIISRMKADRNKTCLYASTTCLNGLFPQRDTIHENIRSDTCTVVIGLSSYGMFLGQKKLQEILKHWLTYSPCGHLIVLLCHVQDTLRSCMGNDPHFPRRVVFLQGEPSPLPRIRFFPADYEGKGEGLLGNFQNLLQNLETYDSSAPVAEYKVRTRLTKKNFPDSLLSIASFEGFFSEFCKSHREVAASLRESWGSEEEWKDFATDWEICPSFDGLAKKYFHIDGAYYQALSSVWKGREEYKKWFLWLLLKVKGALGSPYLSFVLSHSENYGDLWDHIYLDITQVDRSDTCFEGFFRERKNLLKEEIDTGPLQQKYQNALAQLGKESLFYISDGTTCERWQLFFCLANYTYEKKEIQWVLSENFPDLFAYMKPFIFTPTQIDRDDSEKELCHTLTQYFDKYKWQKLENYLDPDFEVKVEDLATQRIYNRLPERSLTMKKVDRNTSTIFFIDALGVEYLSYIQEKCKDYGLWCNFRICHGQLPSITAANKEFVHPDTKIVKDLDELKHHSQTYDYEKQKLPIHLVAELQVIDKLLQDIFIKLLMKEIQRAVLVSDHGATRLAVLAEEEKGADFIIGENKGQHGGRCCLAEEDPHIPYAAYENGYVVLANYSRFKGSRKADVEVHGGATLEEVLVPVITISLAPNEVKVWFKYNSVRCKKKEPPQLILQSNFDMEKPLLQIHDKVYVGILDIQKRFARFVLEDIKRKGDYVADVYDGEHLIQEKLPFHVEREVVKINDPFDL